MSAPRAAEIFGADPPGSLTDGIQRRFQNLGDGRYVLELPAVGIAFELDRLRRERHELLGELLVRCSLAGARTFDGVLQVGDFNCSSVRARQERARALAERSNAPDVDWLGLLEELVQRVLAAERQGSPAVLLPNVPKPGPEAMAAIDGLSLPLVHPIILFGDGGTGKSYMAEYFAGTLIQRGIPAAFIDWELDEGTHRNRLEQLFGPTMPALQYVRCDRPLVAEADRLRRLIRELGIRYAIFDSIAYACDGPPEAAETAASYFRACRQLGIGSLHIAHTTKNAETNDRQPFGSVFWHNSARATWYAKQADAADPQTLSLGLFNRKNNLGPLHPAIGFDLTFNAERIRIQRADVAENPSLAVKLSLPERIKGLLRHGSLSIAAIAESLDAKEDSVIKAVKRGENKVFTRRVGKGGVFEIGLLDRRTER